jgi:hypothetical protein
MTDVVKDGSETQADGITKAHGYYSEVIVDEPPTDLFFRQVPGALPPPEDLRQLKLALEAAAQVTVTFFRSDLKNKRKFMERLRLAGQVGCCGPHYVVFEGIDSLESTKRQIVEEGYTLRNSIWYTYTLYTLLILIPCVLVGFARAYPVDADTH